MSYRLIATPSEQVSRPYKQVGGLGKPANLQAYFKGPSGNKRSK